MRAKTFVAVGHETANKGEHGKNLRRDTMDANLLSNMELGIHADAAPGRQTSDLVRLCHSVVLTPLLGSVDSYSSRCRSAPKACYAKQTHAGLDGASDEEQQQRKALAQSTCLLCMPKI